jgi:hypothetical protein
MESGPPNIVLNLYDWLPGYGESGIMVRSQGLEWAVEIAYDDTARTGLLKRELRFNGVCCFYQASFPGPSLLAIDCQTGDTLGSLVEYPESEAALAWKDHFGNTRVVKHYAIWFMSENSVIQVFAESFTLAEPVRVQVP